MGLDKFNDGRLARFWQTPRRKFALRFRSCATAMYLRMFGVVA